MIRIRTKIDVDVSGISPHVLISYDVTFQLTDAHQKILSWCKKAEIDIAYISYDFTSDGDFFIVWDLKDEGDLLAFSLKWDTTECQLI